MNSLKTMNAKTKKLTAAAMLCAMAFTAVSLCRVHIVMFLEYEPKDVIITLGGFLFGPLTSLFISAVVSFIEMITISEDGVLGLIMNVISTCAFSCTASFIYRRKKTPAGAFAGLAAGAAVMVCAVLLWDYLIVPVYMGYPRADVAKMLLPAFLPFNILKAGLNAAFVFLLYRPLLKVLDKVGYISEKTESNGGKTVGFCIISCMVIATCVLLILSFNQII